MEFHIPKDHPRYWSLVIREKLVKGFYDGYVVPQGLIAHGRGEAFDYLIGEETRDFAVDAMGAAVALMLLARHPVISVNGNVAALVGKELVELAKILRAKVEVNLFYRTRERERRIAQVLRGYGLEDVLGVDDEICVIPELHSERRKVSCRGIYIADVVMVPLEDGDRTVALKRMGKKVIAIDLNPLSRTSQVADVTIVDNVVRAVPKMMEIAKEMTGKPREHLESVVRSYDNREILRRAISYILSRLSDLASKGVFVELS